jgi:hypothetical protein
MENDRKLFSHVGGVYIEEGNARVSAGYLSMLLEAQIHCGSAVQAALGHLFSPHPTTGLPHLQWLGDSFADEFLHKTLWITNTTGTNLFIPCHVEAGLELDRFPLWDHLCAMAYFRTAVKANRGSSLKQGD